ncbi:class I SAM-dependent methyltransferase [Candidatus Uhrbacteria bacterium]|nr:class I SAM-dependent methyltransferase [Candidatus Uhrbacteria bacterium]
MQSIRDTEILNSVTQTYDAIAGSWDRVRRRPGKVWNVLLPYIHEGDRVLDIGCGSGRLYEFLRSKNAAYTGIDGSRELIEIARARYSISPSFLVSPMQSLPLGNASFDVICCLAAFHHLPSVAIRQHVLDEFRRVLTPTGVLLMTNWSTYHLLSSWRLRPLPILTGRRDVMIPWKLPDGRVYQRFYHAFLLSELSALLEASGWEIKTACYIGQHGMTRWFRSLYSFVVATPQ